MSQDTANTLDAAAIAHLQQWVGKSEELHDDITAAPLRGLSATLDRDDAQPAKGTPVPPLGHWLYFLPQAPQSQIGPDGHPKRGGFLPPVPLERRMWAGGRLRFHAPLTIGEEMFRRSEITKVSEKTGSTGRMVFVTVRHDVHGAAGLAIEEEQDIVFIAMPDRFTPPPPVAAPEPDRREDVAVDEVRLFRFSALTFNAHRIHFDLP